MRTRCARRSTRFCSRDRRYGGLTSPAEAAHRARSVAQRLHVHSAYGGLGVLGRRGTPFGGSHARHCATAWNPVTSPRARSLAARDAACGDAPSSGDAPRVGKALVAPDTLLPTLARVVPR